MTSTSVTPLPIDQGSTYSDKNVFRCLLADLRLYFTIESSIVLASFAALKLVSDNS